MASKTTRGRPSIFEINKKIRAAKKLYNEKRVFFYDDTTLAREALELGIDIFHDDDKIKKILEEIKCNYYCGLHPPQKSYETEIYGSELFAFRWDSDCLGLETYLKFAIIEGDLWIISLHPHREQKKGKEEALKENRKIKEKNSKPPKLYKRRC